MSRRTYRTLMSRPSLVSFQVQVQQTDLLILATQDLREQALAIVLEERRRLERYIERHPQFADTLTPWPEDPLAPPLVQEMIQAAAIAGVGPLAAVAGAIAAAVGRRLSACSREIIVENGGDIYLHLQEPAIVSLYAGASPLSLKIGLQISPDITPLGVCTSSGTIGHSLSLGRADAACVVAPSAALADAAATALGNRVRRPRDIEPTLKWLATLPGGTGGIVILGDKLGAWGELELRPLE